MHRFSLLICLSVLTSLFLAASATADIVNFTATLDSTLSGTGSAGTGTATATLDTSTGNMTINGNFSGLGSNATVAHLHGFATPGGNAGILINLTVTQATSGSFSGSGTISGDDANYNMTRSGNTYINIHSNDFGGGEIRGHLNATIPEPASACFLLVGTAGLVLFPRRRR